MKKLINKDCMEFMRGMDDGSVDLIVTDPPYGSTQHEDDERVNTKKLWGNFENIIKENGAIIITCDFSYGVELANKSTVKFRYDLVWDKELKSGHLNANRMPLRQHENILVFYKSLPTYNPQFTKGEPLHDMGKSYKDKEQTNNNYGDFEPNNSRSGETKKYPTSIQNFQKPHPSKARHRTEKPETLFEWIIKTYSNKNDLVFDPFFGSGNSMIMSERLNRNWIGCEINEEYYNIAKDRMKERFDWNDQ